MSTPSYEAFLAAAAARGRPVCDAFEPCKAAQEKRPPKTLLVAKLHSPA